MSRKTRVLISVLIAAVLLTVGGTATVMAQEEEIAPTPAPASKIFRGTANTTGLLARVAEILEIPQEDLVDAFQQAQQEMKEEALGKVMDKVEEALSRVVAKALEKGLIDEAEAEAFQEWWQQRPEHPDQESIRQWLEERPEISKPGLLKRILKVPFRFKGHRQGAIIEGQAPGRLIGRVAEILGIPQEDLVSAFRQAQQEMRADVFIRLVDKAWEQGRLTEEEAQEIKEWWAQKPESLNMGLLQRAFGTPGLHGRQMRGSHRR